MPDSTEILPLLDRVIRGVVRRKCLSHEDAEDFGSWVRLRFLDDKRDLVERFEGRSSLQTYLTAVVLNLLRDYRIQSWGKYRPSAAARRLGPTAERLEMLMTRDGFGFEEAARILVDNHKVRTSLDELATMAGQLPARTGRLFEDAAAIERLPASESADDLALLSEATASAARLESALAEALRLLKPEDRLILKLRVTDGLSVAEVARTLRLEQKPLYRRLERLHDKLRRHLERHGLDKDAVGHVLSCEEVAFQVDFGVAGESGQPVPSEREGGR